MDPVHNSGDYAPKQRVSDVACHLQNVLEQTGRGSVVEGHAAFLYELKN